MARIRYDWTAVQRYHDEGNGFVACRRRFGFTHTAWTKAIRSGKLRTAEARFGDRRRKYDWAAGQRYYDEGHSLPECCAEFGFSFAAWSKARQRGELNTRPPGRPLDELLEVGVSRYNIKHRLLRAGILENRCAECGLTEWRGKKLSIQIDHVNGIRNDNRLENLRMLCPNCHSQTETFGGFNINRSRFV